uniref:Uncharacterized protein n=1 Tax=Avena sativa TaxID=4498 RepID=A0ACD5W8S7_AVESA
MTPSPSTRTFRRLSPTEIADRKKGLCFNCDDQFVPGHRCAHLFSVEVNASADYDEVDETMHRPTDLSDEEPRVSLQVMTGLWSIGASNTMQLDVRIGMDTFTALLDTGSTHNFIDSDALVRAKLTHVARPGLRVMVANGDHVASKGVMSAGSIKHWRPHLLGRLLCDTSWWV